MKQQDNLEPLLDINTHEALKKKMNDEWNTQQQLKLTNSQHDQLHLDHLLLATPRLVEFGMTTPRRLPETPRRKPFGK